MSRLTGQPAQIIMIIIYLERVESAAFPLVSAPARKDGIVATILGDQPTASRRARAGLLGKPAAQGSGPGPGVVARGLSR